MAEAYLSNKDESKQAIEALQRATAPNHWALFGYKEDTKDQLHLLGTGSSGLSELEAHFNPDTVAYAILGVFVGDSAETGQYKTIKHIFITWVGPSVKPLEKARSSQHRVLLYNFAKGFLQLQGELQALSREELSEDKLVEKLMGAKLTQEATASPSPVKQGSTDSPKTKQLSSSGGASEEPKVKFANLDGAIAAIKDLGNAGTNTNWVAFGYEKGKNDQIALLATGSGGFKELESHFAPAAIVYAILGINVVDKNEGADYGAFKHIFITWVGPKVKPLDKARSSQHRVAIYEFSKNHAQIHGEFQALSKEEISEEKLVEKLSGSRLASDNLKASGDRSRATTTTKELNFQFKNPAEVDKAIEDLRSHSSDTDWIVLGYEQEAVGLLGKGAGGLPAAQSFFKDEDIIYSVLGVRVHDDAKAEAEGEEEDDGVDYTVVKHILVTWVGPNVKPLQKAKSSQHRVAIYNHVKRLLQLQGEYQVFTREEISDAKLVEKLTGARIQSLEGTVPSGTSSPNTGKWANPAFTGLQTFNPEKPSKEQITVVFKDEAAAKSALETLRKDAQPNNWVLFGYDNEKENKLSVLANGAGGLTSLVNTHFNDENTAYAVLGINVVDADYSTLKYICLTWVGPKVKPLEKARTSQHRVALYNFAKNYLQLAAELQALTKEELSDQALVDKILGSRVK